MESNKPIGIIGSKSALMLALNQMDALQQLKDEAERGIKITNEPQINIPFVADPTIPHLPMSLTTNYHKPKKPNTGLKLGSYTYKSKRK